MLCTHLTRLCQVAHCVLDIKRHSSDDSLGFNIYACMQLQECMGGGQLCRDPRPVLISVRVFI